MHASNQQDIKSANRAAILEQIRRSAPISRQQIAANLQLSPSTVTMAVQELIARGLVEETGPGVSSGGRPPVLLNLKSGSRYIISVDVSSIFGQRIFQAAVLDLTGHLVASVKHSRELSSGEEMTEAIFDIIDRLIEESGVGLEKALAIGLSLPGLIDSTAGMVIFTGIGICGLPLGELLQERYGLPALLYNSEDVAALGEYYFGAGKGASSLLYFFAGNGVGAGIVLDGKIFPCTRISAAEIGHMTILPDGPPCHCGSRGCLTRLISSDVILDAVRQRCAGQKVASLEDVLQAARSGQKDCLDVIQRCAEWVGIAISNTIHLINPQVIIFDGELFGNDDFFLKLVKEAVSRHSFQYYLPEVQMYRSTLGREAGLKRIGILAIDQVFQS